MRRRRCKKNTTKKKLDCGSVQHWRGTLVAPQYGSGLFFCELEKHGEWESEKENEAGGMVLIPDGSVNGPQWYEEVPVVLWFYVYLSVGVCYRQGRTSEEGQLPASGLSPGDTEGMTTRTRTKECESQSG